MFKIDDEIAYEEFLEYIDENNYTISTKSDNIVACSDGNSYEFLPKYYKQLETQNLIFGKKTTKGIVAIEVVNNELWLFKQDKSIEKIPMYWWVLENKPNGGKKLAGDLHYKYLKKFKSKADMNIYASSVLYKKRRDFLRVYDPSEAEMVRQGYTLFKGMRISDVSALSFDIETTGIEHNFDSKVLMISNTFRDSNGKITKKLFSVDDYDGDDKEMIEEWCEWVQERDPDILLGHNIFGYDLPYLSYCYGADDVVDLPLGRDCSSIKYSDKTKKFRKDGSQEYDYHDAHVFGRQVIDTFFLSIRYDFARKFPSYGLKPIVDHLGLEREGRIKWDFEKHPPKELYEFSDVPGTNAAKLWEQFKEYAIDDADDSLKLFDLMMPNFFYYSAHLPMSLQKMHQTATGRQLNNFLMRGYLQEGHSIPKKSDKKPFGGGISMGVPGVYGNVYKVDVASLYPSIMLTEKIYNPEKDPQALFLKTVEYFTHERLVNKKKGKDTGDPYFKSLEQAQKIVINSAYGLLGTAGLEFNYMEGADKVTATGREILQKGVEWACGHRLVQTPKLSKTGKIELNKDSGKPKLEWVMGPKISDGKGYQLTNVDTDSFSYSVPKKMTDEQFQSDIDEVNNLFPDGIVWEDDGYYDKFVVLKAKNYIKKEGKKISYTGSGLKDQKGEPILKDFMHDVIDLLLAKKNDHIMDLYEEYSKKINSITNIEPWCKKVTVTEKLMTSDRTNETSIFAAIKDGHYQQGDKFYLFVEAVNEYLDDEGKKKKATIWKKREEFKDLYDKSTYLKKLHSSLGVFENVIDISLFPDYTKSRNKELYDKLL